MDTLLSEWMVSVISMPPSSGDMVGTLSRWKALFLRVWMLMTAYPTIPKAGRRMVLLLTGLGVRLGVAVRDSWKGKRPWGADVRTCTVCGSNFYFYGNFYG